MNDPRLTTARLTMPQLQWLLASLALVMGLHALHLQPWITLLALVSGAWRYAAMLGRLPMPRTRLLLPIAAATTIAILASHGGLFGRNASLSLLTSMMALKLLESHTRRDVMVLVFLAYFLGITSFLHSQSLLVGAYLVLPVLALTATLVIANHPNGSLPPKLLLRIAGIMLAQSVPIMLALFLLFPRVQGPLWGVPQDALSGMTGLSDSMSPGSISQLSQSADIAFRVEFAGKFPSYSQLYWRGPVFWHYDGRTWRSGVETRKLPQEKVQASTAPIRYSVTLEPHNRRWLFMLDLPALTPPDSTVSNDYQLLTRGPVRTRIRYQAASVLSYKLGLELDPKTQQQALQLPLKGNPRALALGREWRDSGANADAIAQRALAMFREQPFTYTLTPPLLLGDNAVDDFLFSTHRGFCEHFSGSFVFLMRAAGVPARVVTGYQGGEINPIGHYLLVRQADAHAWAEIWLEGRGWVRIDPTAAVSPQRVESGVAAALPAGEPVPPLLRADMQWLRQLYLRWDAINNGWNQWVLGYNQQRQMELLARLAGTQVSMQEMVIALTTSLSLIVLVVTWGMLRGAKPRIDDLQRSYLKFLKKLASAGIQHQPHEGPQDFGQRAALQLPAQAAAIRTICGDYIRLRYGPSATPQQVAALKQRIREFRF